MWESVQKINRGSRSLARNPAVAIPPTVTAAIILSVTYGIDLKSSDDPFLIAVFEASLAVGAALAPGKFLVDAIPICVYLCAQSSIHKQLTKPRTVRHIPDWFPGMGFKALAKEAREKFKISIGGPMEYVKSVMKVSSECTLGLDHI